MSTLSSGEWVALVIFALTYIVLGFGAFALALTVAIALALQRRARALPVTIVET